MVTIAVVAAALAAWVATLVVGARAAFVVLERQRGASTDHVRDVAEALHHQQLAIKSLADDIERIKLGVQEEVERARKDYARARASESRARRLVEESEDGEDGEDQGVLPFDGEGSDPRGMYPVRDSMAGPQPGARRNLLPFLLTRPGRG